MTELDRDNRITGIAKRLRDIYATHPMVMEAAAEIERMERDALVWQAVSSQGIGIERELRAEVERLTALVRNVSVTRDTAVNMKLERDAEIERLTRLLDAFHDGAEPAAERLNAMLEWCDKMEPGIKRRSEIAIEDEP